MKPPELIKRGLDCCQTIVRCAVCPYHDIGDIVAECTAQLSENALAYIQQLESRLAQVERERDAAVQIVHGLCLHCKNEHSEGETCRECLYYPYRYMYGTGDKYVDNWQWCGVCAENTEEDE